MRAAALLSTPLSALSAAGTVAEAAAALIACGAEALPVTEADGSYVGLFGLADLLALTVPRIALAGDLSANLRFVADDPGVFVDKFAQIKDRPLSAWCDRSAVTLSPDAPAIEALRLFCRGVRVLPLVEPGGALAGTLCPADAVRAISGTE